MGVPPEGIDALPAYFRGEAYRSLQDGAKAAAEYQKVIEQRTASPLNMVLTLAHLGLARTYVMQGDTANCRAAYQDLFAIWKDADSDLPVLKQAKAEYAKLR